VPLTDREKHLGSDTSRLWLDRYTIRWKFSAVRAPLWPETDASTQNRQPTITK
jgi:hypothetical protein